MSNSRQHHHVRRPEPAAEFEQLALFDTRPFLKGVK